MKMKMERKGERERIHCISERDSFHFEPLSIYSLMHQIPAWPFCIFFWLPNNITINNIILKEEKRKRKMKINKH